jgi:hypothetical protein
MLGVPFSGETVKQLKGELQWAYRRGDLCTMHRRSLMVMIGDGMGLMVNLTV